MEISYQQVDKQNDLAAVHPSHCAKERLLVQSGETREDV